jgi:co-chaperonin GroES (HSP10)
VSTVETLPIEMPRTREPEVTIQKDPETGATWMVIPDAKVILEAMGDRLIVKEDPFLSGYECKTCAGEQFLACTSCDHGKNKLNPNMVCKVCGGTMKYDCPDCHGKGVRKGGIVVPDKAQRRPTSGMIVSRGSGCKLPLKTGDSVLYSSFAGNFLDPEVNGKKLILRILHESEVLTRVVGHLSYKRGDDEADTE